MKAREDFYYDEIQKTMKELDRIKSLKTEIPLDKAQDNFREQEFLNGIDGKQSKKQDMESEVLKLQILNAESEKKVILETQLATNRVSDLKFAIMEVDLKIEEQKLLIDDLSVAAPFRRH